MHLRATDQITGFSCFPEYFHIHSVIICIALQASYHEPFNLNNKQLKLHAVHWSTFVQEDDSSSNNETHCAVPRESALLRSVEVQTAEDLSL